MAHAVRGLRCPCWTLWHWLANTLIAALARLNQNLQEEETDRSYLSNRALLFSIAAQKHLIVRTCLSSHASVSATYHAGVISVCTTTLPALAGSYQPIIRLEMRTPPGGNRRPLHVRMSGQVRVRELFRPPSETGNWRWGSLSCWHATALSSISRMPQMCRSWHVPRNLRGRSLSAACSLLSS